MSNETPTRMTLDELVEEANRILDLESLTTDGRTTSRTRARTVRYYQTLGVIPPAINDEGRAWYNQEHLEALLSVKRGQSEGKSLSNIKAGPITTTLSTSGNSTTSSSGSVNSGSSLSVDFPVYWQGGEVLTPQTEVGWSLSLGNGITISGGGKITDPSKIRKAAKELLSEISKQQAPGSTVGTGNIKEGTNK